MDDMLDWTARRIMDDMLDLMDTSFASIDLSGYHLSPLAQTNSRSRRHNNRGITTDQLRKVVDSVIRNGIFSLKYPTFFFFEKLNTRP